MSVSGVETAPAPPGTLRPCDGSGTHGWLEPTVVPTTSARFAVWECPRCGCRWKLGGDGR